MAETYVTLKQNGESVYPETFSDKVYINGTSDNLSTALGNKQDKLTADTGINIGTDKKISVKVDDSTVAVDTNGKVKVKDAALSKVEAVTVGTTQTVKQLKITPAGGTETTKDLLYAEVTASDVPASEINAAKLGGEKPTKYVQVQTEKTTAMIIPDLPSDASTKTYVLICKNGTFEWSDQVVLQS